MTKPLVLSVVLGAALATSIVSAQGKAPAGAPGLKATELTPPVRSFKLVFDKGDEVMSGLADFASRNHIKESHFTAVGAFDHAVIGWYDPEKRAFKNVTLDEEMEVASLTGNITLDGNGKPIVHAHCVVGLLKDGRVYAGHLSEGRVSLTMQLYLDESDPASAPKRPEN